MRFVLEDTSGFTRLAARCERALSDMPELVQKALVQVGDETVKALHEASPVGIGRTGGHLADSFSSVVENTAVSIRTSQYQKLYWVRYGTGIRGPVGAYIVPTTKQFMWWPEAPHPMARVRGQHANDFVTPVFGNVQTYLDEAVVSFADQLAHILEGG
jgi:hypothetical protein